MQKKYWKTALALWLIAMWVLSLMHLQLPEVPSGDKWGHFISYGLLAWLACHVGWKKPQVWLFASLMGVIVECVQYFVPWRSFELLDMLANSSGALLGVLLALLTQRLWISYQKNA